MYLRKLELKDAAHMLSWMHDEDIAGELYKDFATKTVLDCEQFIEKAQDMSQDAHYAIASDEDEYMGTVSLKNIDKKTNSAELAVVVRKAAMGRGYSWFGIETIIDKAFAEYELECVYWCLSRDNYRAERFCDKHNFHEIVDIPDYLWERYKDAKELKWYSVLKGDVLDDREYVAGCKVIHIKAIPTINAGELSFFEANRDIGFDIKRIYYISKVPEGIRRGFHAHKRLKQLLFCPYGRIQLVLENELGREEVELSDPSVGVVIERPTWREMLWLQKDSVLCVAASDFYDVDDYIRDYSKFRRFIEN